MVELWYRFGMIKLGGNGRVLEAKQSECGRNWKGKVVEFELKICNSFTYDFSLKCTTEGYLDSCLENTG